MKTWSVIPYLQTPNTFQCYPLSILDAPKHRKVNFWMETPCQTRNIPDISYLIRVDNVDCIQVLLHCSPLSISQLTMYSIIQELYVSQIDKTKGRINLRLFCYSTPTQIQPRINKYHQETFLTFPRFHLKFLFYLRILFGWLVALLVSLPCFVLSVHVHHYLYTCLPSGSFWL